MSVQQIQAAILELSADDFRQLADWLMELDQKRFDEQFERDMLAAKFDGSVEEEAGELQSDHSLEN
ncbi:MAG: hypothetical protein ACJ8C4_19860 [Gemmataceae bacterium]